ncbi:hypothetical protein MKX03_037133 [Papaver bracteatum]|nr:hypothetical protein MKX03_037133 [Papaver bracteatum]
MNLSCGGWGILPKHIQTMHQVVLPGPYLLQDNYIISDEGRSGNHRRLKLSMTDGVLSAYGVADLEDLPELAVAGLKLIIHNVTVCHGHLKLVPEAFRVLDEMVEDLEHLEAERQKLVDEANKPLYDCANGLGYDAAIATLQNAIPPGSPIQGTPYGPSATNALKRSRETTQQGTEIPNGASNVECNTTSRVAAGFNESDAVVVAMARKEAAGPSKRTKIDCNPSWYTTAPLQYLDDFRIKCVAVGINKFQHDKDEYEVVLVVDDGSSVRYDVCLHHNIVQSRIGYSPQQVREALSPPDKDRVHKAVEEFISTLAYFQGTILVEMTTNSTVPVALEMNDEGYAYDCSWVMAGLKRFSGSGEFVS